MDLFRKSSTWLSYHCRRAYIVEIGPHSGFESAHVNADAAAHDGVHASAIRRAPAADAAGASASPGPAARTGSGHHAARIDTELYQVRLRTVYGGASQDLILAIYRVHRKWFWCIWRCVICKVLLTCGWHSRAFARWGDEAMRYWSPARTDSLLVSGIPLPSLWCIAATGLSVILSGESLCFPGLTRYASAAYDVLNHRVVLSMCGTVFIGCSFRVYTIQPVRI